MSTEEQENIHHPRFSHSLLGHDAAEKLMLQRFNEKKLHHAWLITGPKGIGKATLAYRFARFLLAQPDDDPGASLFGDALPSEPPSSLEISPDHPIAQRIASGGHGNLRIIERVADDKGKIKAEITIDPVRELISFFSQTAAEGGWRVAIIDAIDHLNRNASNALLKLLEEPPKKSILLLVSHAPGGLLPTIRSRCQRLSLKELSDEQVNSVLVQHQDMESLTPEDRAALAKMAVGSPGRALELIQHNGLDLYRRLVGLLARLPHLRTLEMHQLATEISGAGKEEKWRMFMALFRDFIGSLIRHSANQQTMIEVQGAENQLLSLFQQTSGLDRWIEVWEKMGELTRRTEAIHLDKAQVTMQCLMLIQDEFSAHLKTA